MEVFSVFATLSLVDLLSGPLGTVQATMRGMDTAAASLGARMGKLALAMAPVALAAGLMLGVFGLAASKAMAFESAMADVAKVVNFDSQAEFAAMSAQVKELSGRIPMAADGIAAIIAAAGQSGVAKQDLAEFAEQAAKMGVAFDLSGDQAGKMMADWRAGMHLTLPQTYALADATNYLSNNMNAAAPALGEVIQRVGAAAMACGLAETQVAALGAAFLSAGASPEVAATALKKFTSTLVKGAAMSKEQAAAFSGLGFSVSQMAKDMQTDAQGTIFKVLQAIADKPKELQMSLLTEMFGEEAIGAIAPLLKNMGLLSQAFELVGDASTYAGSMQAEFEARSKTTQNALQLLSNKLNNLCISVGSVFLPAIAWAADKLGTLADAVRFVVDTPFGKWVLGIAGGLAAALVSITALSAAFWFFSAAGPMLGKALAPLKAALVGLGWPVLAVIAAVGLLYVAYRENFGGMADILNGWWNTISLVVRGVIGIFKSLKGNVFELRGALAEDIQAAGLEGLVLKVAKVVYRIKEFFSGLVDSLSPSFERIGNILGPTLERVGAAFGRIFSIIGDLFSRLFGGEVQSASEQWNHWGTIMGTVVAVAFEKVALILNLLLTPFEALFSAIGLLISLFSGDLPGAADALRGIFSSLGNGLAALADLFNFGDQVRAAWAEVMAFFESINLFESGARILATLAEGIKSAVMLPFNAVQGAFEWLANLLPFSDAREGPLSSLTLSGSRVMSTLGEGIAKGAGGLYDTVAGALSNVGASISGWWDSLFGDVASPDMALAMQAPSVPEVRIPDPPAFATAADLDDPRQGQGRAGTNSTITIHIGTIELPNVAHGQDFVNDLQGLVAEYGGGMA